MGLSLVGLITDRLAPAADGALIPHLVAAPADKAKLRMRGRPDSAPMRPGQPEFQVEGRIRRHPHEAEGMQPGALIPQLKARLIVPVFAELHRQTARHSCLIAEQWRKPGRRCDTGDPQAVVWLVEEQPEGLFCFSWIGKGDSDPLQSIVMLAETRNFTQVYLPPATCCFIFDWTLDAITHGEGPHSGSRPGSSFNQPIGSRFQAHRDGPGRFEAPRLAIFGFGLFAQEGCAGLQ